MADPLISVEGLARIVDDPFLRIVDTRWDYLDDPERGLRDYMEGHIPGAQHLDVASHLSGHGGPGRHPLPPPAAFAATMGRHGIGDDHLVVVYDDQGGAVAGRLWWMLRWIGHGSVRVLDGGLQAWMAVGGALSTEVPSFPPAEMTVRPPLTREIERASLFGRLGSLTVLDARAPERYRGEEEPIDPVAGHIPTAVSAPHADTLDEAGLLLPPAELSERFRRIGADAAGVVVYCGSGVTACLDILAMVAAGLPEPMLYPGSWSDWSSSGMPVATGPEPGTAPPSPGYEVDPVFRQIVQIADYEPTGDPGALLSAVAAIAERVAAEGAGTIARFTFFAHQDTGMVSLVGVFADADSWTGHHEMLDGWEAEFGALRRSSRQTRLRLFGPVSPAMRSWLESRGLPFEEGGVLVSGFER